MLVCRPKGVADFTGNGQEEVALVVTPHIGGVLTLYQPEGARLEKIAAVPGYSNHAIGSRELGLSWVGHVDSDELADIILPTQSRRSLSAVSLTAGAPYLIAQSGYYGHIETSLVPMELEDGTFVILFADDRPALRWLHLPARP